MPLASFVTSDHKPNKRAIVEMAAFNACIYKNARQSAQDILDLNGGGAILAGNFDPDGFAPSWAMATDSESNVYIVFAGTTNVEQMISHVGGVLGVPYTEWDEESGIAHLETLVHPWWALAWSSIRTAIVQAYLASGATGQLRITGHSYGGAVGQLAALFFSRLLGGLRVQLMTFGAPFALGTGYDGEQPSAQVRVVSESDIVPSLGPQLPFYLIPLGFLTKQATKRLASFGHFGQRITINQDGSSIVDEGQAKLWLLRPASFYETVSGDAHYMRNYTRIARRMWDRNGFSLPTSTVAAVGETVANGLEVPEARVVLHRQYQTLAQQAEIYFDGSDGVLSFLGVPNRKISSRAISVETHGVEEVVSTNGSASLPFFTTILSLGQHMAASGFWKLTLIINNGKYGTSTSVIWKKESSTLEDAMKKGMDLASSRSFLLGNGGAEANPAKSLKSPRIEFLRVSDALNPRLSQIFEITSVSGVGVPAVDNAADVFSTALTVRLTGISQGEAPRESISNHQIIGQPDLCVKQGRYDGTVAIGGGQPTMDSAVKNFLNFLTGSTDQFGFMGQHTGETIKNASAFTYNNLGKYQFTCTAHGYSTRDRIRITAANAKGFNGVHLVEVVDSNTLYLHSAIPEGLALPTTARVQRVQLASGVRKVEFYKFQRPAAGWVTPFGIKVSKKNLAREYTGVSFRRRAR